MSGPRSIALAWILYFSHAAALDLTKSIEDDNKQVLTMGVEERTL